MSIISHAASEAAAGPGPFRALTATLVAWWVACMTRRLQRLAADRLHGMTDRELKDIGLTRPEIEAAVRYGRLSDRLYAAGH